MAQRLWSREEFILALDLYFRTPFGQIHKSNPDIIKLAELLGRTPSSVGMRLSNFANCDPELRAAGIKGLDGAQKKCQPYWDEFAGNRGKLLSAAIECRAKLIESTNPDSEIFYKHITEWDNLVDEMYDYKFQNIVSKNYHNRCALSGLTASELLVACHIIPSSINEEESMKASNGLYLTLLHARAYVEGLIGFDTNYKIHIAPELKQHQFESGYVSNFKKYEGKSLNISDVTVKPDPTYLEWHMDTVFRKAI